MSEHTTKAWSDASWPATSGCGDESPGCANGDSKRESHRLAGNPKVAADYAGTTEWRDTGPIPGTGRTLDGRGYDEVPDVRRADGEPGGYPAGPTIAGPTPPGPGAPGASVRFALDLPTGLARRSFPPRGVEPGLAVSY